MSPSRIKILPKELSDKIAAGEVVSRPAAVVKELVENALDAASTVIEIMVEDAGRRSIKVADNGQGMGPEDLKLVGKRHATSKIAGLDDLDNIRTLGFRGEALASIAAVSQMSITSRDKLSPCGFSLKAEAGETREFKETARNIGTTVEARNLFFNTPARLKFLKSNAAEMSQIVQVITELSLAYPHISFKLEHNGEEILNFRQNDGLFDRVQAALGAEVAQKLTPIYLEIPSLKLSGFIARAGFGYGSRKNQFIFVNKRPVIDKMIAHALKEGYRTFLSEKQFAPALIFVDTASELVDVNVHPNKREVRFRQANVLHDLLVRAISQALIKKDGLAAFAPRIPIPVSSDTPRSRPSVSEPEQETLEGEQQRASSASLFGEEEKTGLGGLVKGPVKFLQAKNTYVVFQSKDGIVLLDQHAAHERIIFDELNEQFQNKRIEKQKLLLPLTLRLDKAQTMLVNEVKDVFYGLGFEIEEFGANCYALHSYPAALETEDIKGVFESTISEIADLGLNPKKESTPPRFIAAIACHAAVRANQRLSGEQIEKLIDRLWQTEAPYTCPHGRPTMITLGWEEIEKKFKRR